MRRELIWGLAASAGLSAWALIDPATKGEATVVRAAVSSDREDTTRPVVTNRVEASSTDIPAADRSPPLPATWPRPSLDPAPRNPFQQPRPPTPPPVATAPPPTPAPPPPPALPTLTYRLWGTLSAPDGHRVVYVAHGDNAAPVEVQVGTRLEDGFTVEQLTDEVVVFVHDATTQRFALSLPPTGAPSAAASH